MTVKMVMCVLYFRKIILVWRRRSWTACLIYGHPMQFCNGYFIFMMMALKVWPLY